MKYYLYNVRLLEFLLETDLDAGLFLLYPEAYFISILLLTIFLRQTLECCAILKTSL